VVVTGTDRDLRKVSLEDSKRILLDFGMTEEEIAEIPRWYGLRFPVEGGGEKKFPGIFFCRCSAEFGVSRSFLTNYLRMQAKNWFDP